MSPRRYSEEEFRAAVADPEVRTIADLCRRLGIVPRGGNYESVRTFAHALGIDIDRLEPPPTHRQLVEAVPEPELRGAVADSTSLAATVRALGLADIGAATSALRERIDALGIDTTHFVRRRPIGPGSRFTYTDDELRRALDDRTIDSFAALCDRLGLTSTSNTRWRLRQRAAALGIEIPKSWSAPGPRRNRRPRLFEDVEAIEAAIPESSSLADILRAIGATPDHPNYDRLRRTIEAFDLDLSRMAPPRRRGTTRTPLDELLVKGRRCGSSGLRQRLVEAGIKEHRCERCGLDVWAGGPIPLELDHIDGDRWNNELENLRLLCPNCHALTPTYRGRNIGRRNGPSAT